MPAANRKPSLDEVSRKWRDLAERRLRYFTELYRSGRWKHYYTQEKFALRMLDVIRAAKVWRELADSTPAQNSLAQSSPALGNLTRDRPARDDRMRPAA